MKKMNRLLIIALSLSVITVSCDKNFGKINTNPNAVNDIDPGLLFTSALRNNAAGGLETDHTVAMMFMNAFGGLTAGFNLNVYNSGQNEGRFGLYGGPVKNLVHIIYSLKNDPSRSNLYNMSRIWLAYNYMLLVDTYGDVPYSEAGLAYLEAIFYPKYDNDADIYADLRTELKEASAALDPSKPNEAKYDVFYKGDIAKWKRLGYSLLLRLGMRYTKINSTLAGQIAQEAVAGGVMQSNADNVYLYYTTVVNAPWAGLRNTNSNYYYFAEPFIAQLKSTDDPRLKFLAGKYADAGGDHSQDPDTTTANQVGFPVGQDNVSIATYPGRVIPHTAGGGFNYSQLNFKVIGNALAPQYIITYAQTKLLLAEATQRGYITGSAQQHYEEGVRAALDEYSLYPNGYGTGTVSISTAEKDAFLANPGVTWNPANALRLINTQYWIASFRNGTEAWANMRRSGFPAIPPNPANGGITGGDGYVHRFYYPIPEQGNNKENYDAAKAAMGGDNWNQRVFWDN